MATNEVKYALLNRSACVLSTYYKNKDGYAIAYSEGKMHLHHRLAYIWANKLSIEEITGKIVMHTCDTPACINPEHLKLGTQQDNVSDMMNKRRGIPKKLTPAEVAEIRASTHLTNKELCLKYACGNGTICRVIAREGAYA